MSQQSTAPFDVRVEAHDTALVAFVSGEADVLNSEKLEKALTPLIAQRPLKLIVEMSKVTMISSLAMGKLVGARKAMSLHNGQIILAAPIPLVHDAFRRARLTDIFTVVASVEDALK